MADNEKKPPFPQANDFNKVMSLLDVEDEKILHSDKLLGDYLDGIAERQSRYYIAAAQYLDLIDSKRNFTEFAKRIRAYDAYSQRVEVIQRIFGYTLIGKIYISEKLYNMDFCKEDIIEMIKEEYPGYTDCIYSRRAQSALSWLSWIKEQLGEAKNK